ncbi:hypothetical protein [Streptomyces sp. NPDC048560]|uniref:hypothetical protein n=1 Tax=Streptomyces sp. NPDC048560 TaxID=3155488 RepID=UPI003449E4DF
MTKLLLSVHVLAAILAVGSITVAASMFPRYAVQALGSGGRDGRAAAIAALLHRVCRGYALAGLAVPVFGIATGAQLGVLTDAWLIASLALTAIAAALLAAVILPGQQRLLALDEETPAGETAAAQDTPAREDAVQEASAQEGPAPLMPEARLEAMARPAAMRLTMITGMFNVLWAVVVVLMIVRPGSTTGA